MYMWAVKFATFHKGSKSCERLLVYICLKVYNVISRWLIIKTFLWKIHYHGLRQKGVVALLNFYTWYVNVFINKYSLCECIPTLTVRLSSLLCYWR